MLLNLFLFILGFVLLTRGADVFVDGAAAISRRMHIPEIVIGLTLVAMGTSAPETAVSIFGNLGGAAGISIGNIIGSNIVNILLILGVAACISTLKLTRNTVRYEIPFVAFITCVLGLLGKHYGQINYIGASILLGLFAAFFVYLFKTAKPDNEPVHDEQVSGFHICVMIVAGLLALIWGSNMIINSATAIAQYAGVPQRIIGLTIVAFATSLPELSTCVSAAIKKKSDLVVGNIIGSNIFNILFVLGVACLFKPIPFESKFIGDVMVAIAVVVLLWVLSLRNHKLGHCAGILFIFLYAVYIACLVMV